MYPEDQFAVRAIKSGASAYLTKDISSKELTEAIKKILSGERYISSSIADLITNELRDNHKGNGHELLSDREYQVFLLIAKGNNVSAVALELSLSVKTISVYRGNILKKMNLKNNAEITYYAFKHNLVE
jgi:DNA-binding NarL/FixJ family response regulator